MVAGCYLATLRWAGVGDLADRPDPGGAQEHRRQAERDVRGALLGEVEMVTVAIYVGGPLVGGPVALGARGRDPRVILGAAGLLVNRSRPRTEARSARPAQTT